MAEPFFLTNVHQGFITLNNCSVTLLTQGRFSEAKETFRNALALLKSLSTCAFRERGSQSSLQLADIGVVAKV
jgi:hypothetical protein